MLWQRLELGYTPAPKLIEHEHRQIHNRRSCRVFHLRAIGVCLLPNFRAAAASTRACAGYARKHCLWHDLRFPWGLRSGADSQASAVGPWAPSCGCAGAWRNALARQRIGQRRDLVAGSSALADGAMRCFRRLDMRQADRRRLTNRSTKWNRNYLLI
jgi:hypothetical protein